MRLQRINLPSLHTESGLVSTWDKNNAGHEFATMTTLLFTCTEDLCLLIRSNLRSMYRSVLNGLNVIFVVVTYALIDLTSDQGSRNSSWLRARILRLSLSLALSTM
ncbi:hypothetical protein TNCV_1343501 [Trichonephila clavipes]|nr:hypothetical protein TNCV_1343501 [Trichonephila clavipes]